MFEHITYKESTLPNGLKLLTAQNSSMPIIDAEIWTRAGYRYEQPDNLGYAHLLEHMLLKGTKRRPTPYDLALEVDRKGGYFNARTSQESVVYEMEMMSQDSEDICDILSDMIFNSTLDPGILENEKKVVLQELKQSQEDSSRYISRLTQKIVFQGHPLSNNILGTEETTKNATPEKLRGYLLSHYRPNQSALIMTGDISHERATELAIKYFGSWQNPSNALNSSLSPIPKAADRYHFKKRDIKQTFLSINYYLPRLEDIQKEVEFILLKNYLAYSKTSVLNHELRNKNGLVYNVSSYVDTYEDAGLFQIITSTQKPKEVINIIEKIVADIPNALTDDAFERVREQSIGGFIRYAVKPTNQSRTLGNNFILYGRMLSPEEWIGYLKSAKRENIIAITKKYLRPENSVTIAIGHEDIKS